MKLIHLSDTHIGRNDNAARFSMVIDELVRHPPDNPANCLILHTGDVIDSATPEHRQRARALLEPLRQAGYRMLLCPGNHDYGDAWEINGAAANAFRQEMADYLFGQQPHSFPVLHLIGERHAFIGLDSNAAELSFWQRWFAEGHLGAAQLDALNRLLDSEAVHGRHIILYLHHHPFYYGYSVMPDVGDGHPFRHLLAWLTRPFRRMKDAYSLLEIIRDRVDMLLFGHMHQGLQCSDESRKYGIPLALDGSSTTDTEHVHDRLRYRVIDLDTGDVRTHMIRLNRT